MSALYGTYTGIVVSVQDPHARGRIRLRIPQLTGAAVIGWAEPVSAGAVAPGDQVVVAFEGGDANRPLFWPRAPADPLLREWQPLVLEPGWEAASSGDPAARLTDDGMIELAGSVQTSSALTVGSTIKFSSLPQGMVPLHRVKQLAATDYRGAFRSRSVLGEYRITHTTASTSYTADSNGPVVEFIAPASGEVILTYGANMQTSTTTGRALMAVRVKRGGTVIAEAEDHTSVEKQSENNSSPSMMQILKGLEPGITYTAEAMYRSSTSSSTASFDNKYLRVDPVHPYSAPVARVSIETSGDLLALFPDGTYPYFDLSLAGVKARTA